MPRYDKLKAFQNASNDSEDARNNKSRPLDDSAISVKEKQQERKPEAASIDFSSYLREPRYTLDDVILPQTTRSKIELVLAELQYQDLIYTEWGMADKHKLDKALSVNFSGLPGTGKTITAEALAHALNLNIIDLPYQLLESKFVGETPKNISQAFEFATKNKAVLFFDEADSFLGKRLESVTQSTDTAVNLTRSVMLKELSAYEGVVVFATNLIRNYDPAFISRIRWKIQFDLPDEDARKRIWKIQFPSQLPLDSSVDFSQLAQSFDSISGRDIKNSVFQAVVSAARETCPNDEKKVTQLQLMEAVGQITEANKDALKPNLQFSAASDDIPLPAEALVEE